MTTATLPPPRLPPISRLLAGAPLPASAHDGSVIFGSLPERGSFAGTWGARAAWDNRTSSTTSTTKPSYPATSPPLAFAPPRPHMPDAHKLASSDLHQHTEPSSGSSHATVRRIPSMQLVSPNGGALHPLPSGLVGSFPPAATSPQEDDSNPPFDSSSSHRPRRNSLTGYRYSTPSYYRRTSPGYDRGTDASSERRSSLSAAASAKPYSGAWGSVEPSTGAASRYSSGKRPQDGYQQTASLAGPAPRISTRPRSASSLSDDQRPIASWANEFAPPGARRGSIAESSITSSPTAGPDLDLRMDEDVPPQGPYSRGSTDSLMSLHAPNSNSTASSGTSPPAGVLIPGLFAGKAHELASRRNEGPPDLNTLHINTGDAWRAGKSFSARDQSYVSPTATAAATTILPPVPTLATSAGAAFSPWMPPPPPVASTSANPDDGDGHTEGRYACPHCSKRFARPSSLKTHIHSHTGEKPFECEQCGRGFSVQSNLRRHLRIHRNNEITPIDPASMPKPVSSPEADKLSDDGSATMEQDPPLDGNHTNTTPTSKTLATQTDSDVTPT